MVRTTGSSSSRANIWEKEEEDLLPIPGRFVGKKLDKLVKLKAYLQRKPSEEWTDYDTLFYNAWQSVAIEPPRLLHKQACQTMGIWDEVEELMANLGMGNLGYTEYVTYPDVVRQFIASCELTFSDPHHHRAPDGRLSYKIDGHFYSLSLDELCDIYGFQRRGIETLQNTAFGDQSQFWAHIGSGYHYDPSTTKQTAVRHPALRILAKLLSNTLLSKPEPGRMYKEELLMLYFACNGVITLTWPSPHFSFNMGAVFAAHLEHIKTRIFKGKGKSPKKELIGMLLTPIFLHHRVPFGTHTVDSRTELMDLSHLSRAHIYDGRRYEFFTRGLERKAVYLPNHELTGISSVELLSFRPAEDLLISMPQRHGDPPPETVDEPPVDEPFDIAAHLLPEQPDIDCSEREWRAYTMETHRRQFGLLHRVLSIFSCGGSRSTQTAQGPAPQTAPSARQSTDRRRQSVDRRPERTAHTQGESSATATRRVRRPDESATESDTDRERSRSPHNI